MVSVPHQFENVIEQGEFQEDRFTYEYFTKNIFEFVIGFIELKVEE